VKKPAPKAPVKGGSGGGAGGGGKGTATAKAPPAAGKHQAKAKAKPAKVSRAVHRARHAAAVKASKTRAANAKKAKAHPRRQLALGSAVACCSAEALAASLRLSGWPVSDADVLALYLRTTRDLDAGASILATLEAAAEFGLAGTRPVSFEKVMPDDARSLIAGGAGLILGVDLPGPHAVLDTGSEWVSWGQAWPVSAFPDVVLEEAWTVGWEGRQGS
jgi:hypothetical protein